MNTNAIQRTTTALQFYSFYFSSSNRFSLRHFSLALLLFFSSLVFGLSLLWNDWNVYCKRILWLMRHLNEAMFVHIQKTRKFCVDFSKRNNSMSRITVAVARRWEWDSIRIDLAWCERWENGCTRWLHGIDSNGINKAHRVYFTESRKWVDAFWRWRNSLRRLHSLPVALCIGYMGFFSYLFVVAMQTTNDEYDVVVDTAYVRNFGPSTSQYMQ